MESTDDVSQRFLLRADTPDEINVAPKRSTSRSGAELTFFNGLAIVVGLQIGSGIFLAPSQISSLIPAPGFAVLLWFFTGLFVWTGAASFVELGLAIPRNGGLQEYLQFCYGDFVAFVFICTWVLLIKPAAMAMIAIVFSDHFCKAVSGGQNSPVWVGKAVALFGLSLITMVNCAGIKTGPKVANIFLVLKLCAIYSIGLIGITLIMQSKAPALEKPGFRWFGNVETAPGSTKGGQLWTSLGNYVTAFYNALFCFAGWESVGSISELRYIGMTESRFRVDWLCSWGDEESLETPPVDHQSCHGDRDRSLCARQCCLLRRPPDSGGIT